MLSAFERAAWAVPSRALIDDVTRATRNGGARCSLGCALEEPSGGRDIVVLTDLLRLLPADLQRAQLREALRVGKSAYLLCSGRSAGWPDGASVRRDIEGFPLLPIERLHEAASQAGVALTELPGAGPALRAYALSSNATHGSAGVWGSNG
jgi:hypothetical protein